MEAEVIQQTKATEQKARGAAESRVPVWGVPMSSSSRVGGDGLRGVDRLECLHLGRVP